LFVACLFVTLTITVAASVTTVAAAVATIAVATSAAAIISITGLTPTTAIARGEIDRGTPTIILVVAAGYAIALAGVVLVKAVEVIAMTAIMVAC
jgi:hypothetical protein